jgi:high frequency lysogenization protein
MMNEKNKNQVLALAGILQTADLVNELAAHGNCNQFAFETSIKSIYALEAADLKEIYGYKIEGLTLGLATLEKLLTEEKTMLKKMTLRYFFSLLHLERKFIKDKALTEKLRFLIEKIIQQSNFSEDPFGASVLADLADAYTSTLANFNFRIMLHGNQHYLSQLDNLNKIRALLLAGIRSTVLWRQLGGNRWQLLFQRRNILKTVRELLG